MQKPMLAGERRACRLPSPCGSCARSTSDIAAVDGISFTLRSGAITALLGGNGAGKTTTISMLMGLVIADLAAKRACSAPTWHASATRCCTA